MKNKYKELRNYTTQKGKVPFAEWLKRQKDPLTKARIRRRLDRVEAGHYGDYKAVGEGVYELRLSFGSGYRIYFSKVDEIIIILLCAGDKSTQVKDIKMAKLYWHELQEREYE